MNKKQTDALDIYLASIFKDYRPVFEKIFQLHATFGDVSDEQIEEIVLEHLNSCKCHQDEGCPS